MKETLFILLQHLVPQHLLSRAAGRLADCSKPWLKNWLIKRFINRFGVDMSEAENSNPESYPTFNQFFTRALKEGSRPLEANPWAVASPADGAISEIGKIEYGRILQAKGRGYGLTTLLGGDADRAAPFINGEFCTVYLSPSDYHRVHMPSDATLVESIYVPGDLYSVNQTTANGVDNLFARNERLVCIFETPQGPMAMVLVGAMIVAGIETVWSGQVAPPSKQPLRLYTSRPSEPVSLHKGDEMGRFKLGSTVILLYPEGVLSWHENLRAGTPVRMGETLAKYSQTEADTQ